MLTIHDLEQALLALGYAHLIAPRRFAAGPLTIDLLDAPRLRVQAPTGLYFLAVRSAPQLASLLAELTTVPAPVAAPRWYIG